ncbi:MAG TPA: DUF5666 domain-containing protein [Bryobacteraceae bacterium]|nr:DUF5666 domain-containing protein [Bryobacteraceae bacterium]
MPLSVVAALWAMASAATPQGAPRNQAVGTVASIDAQAGQLSLQTDQGATIAVSATDKTVILHLTPGLTDPSAAPKMAFSEIQQGDRVVAYYRGAPDLKIVQATTLAVRTKGDLADVAKKELEDWRRRGTVGIVTAIDAATKTITLKVGSRTVTVTPSDKTEYHRYSLDSAKPADAKPSSFAEIKMGDQAHVLGNRNPDGTSTTAEIIYAGAFRQLAATIVSVNAAAGEMQVKDLATKKPLTIKVDSSSTMKKLDPQTSAMLARRYGAGRGQGQPDAGTGGGGGQRGGGAGRGGGDIGQLLDRMPAVALADLKTGDAVMVSTTMGSDPSRVTVITLLAGVEPILTAAPNSTRDIMAGWNLGGAGGEGN